MNVEVLSFYATTFISDTRMSESKPPTRPSGRDRSRWQELRERLEEMMERLFPAPKPEPEPIRIRVRQY